LARGAAVVGRAAVVTVGVTVAGFTLVTATRCAGGIHITGNFAFFCRAAVFAVGASFVVTATLVAGLT